MVHNQGGRELYSQDAVICNCTNGKYGSIAPTQQGSRVGREESYFGGRNAGSSCTILGLYFAASMLRCAVRIPVVA